MKQRRVFRVMAAVWIVVLFLLPIVVLCAIGFSASRFGDTYYEAEWFYDSNVHLNESGMVLHTVCIATPRRAFGITIMAT